ncbi:SDR family oxidoreductase [Marinoscillum sp. MHG1-6]|uniref:SDR family oxidoreductase n=1 Tax=Marinoscillum sp. MHG1-6 TaxID=2959627 RepID=UPI0021583047|nr:SDR family oxidoreductase [Marinoscillum sp. MHG1-6]
MISKISILGCGWLGLPLAKSLIGEGYTVKGSTTSTNKLEEIKAIGAEPYQLNLLSRNMISTDFFDSEVMIIAVPPGSSSQEEYASGLNQIKSRYPGHILFISSSSVYPNLNRSVTEVDASPDAKTRKGIPLLEIEKLFNSPKNTIIRFAGLIGPDRHPGKWFAGKENLKGGNCPINMIHLDDCIGIIQTIIKKRLWGETFNACSPEHPSKRAYYPKLSDELGLTAPVFDPDDQSDWKIVSGEKLINKSGYQFKKGVHEVD